MSTKATIAYGPNFHFYHEVFDDDHVYLELEGVQFEAQYNRVMVPIPVHIWGVIRTYPGIDLWFADKTDDEVRQYVEREVDERIAEYQRAEAHAKPLVAVLGALPFGTADAPREQQIEQGMAYFTELRDHRRQLKAAIEELQRSNARG